MLATFRVTAAVLLATLLTSCWIPEKFKATVTVNKDGSYAYTYDGVLTLAPFLAAASQGKLSAKDEAAAQEEAVKLRKVEGFKKVDYLGKGRYQVLVQLQRAAGQPTYFVDKQVRLFSIVPQRDHTIQVSSFRLKPRDIQQFNAIGASIDGELDVDVASGVQVVSQNADSAPKLGGLLGGYVWHIKSPTVAPEIVLRPAS